MGYDTVLYEVTDDHVATVTLNRPEALNSFNDQMVNELVAVWQTIRRDDGVHAVVLCGAGEKGFCAGLDVRDTSGQIGVDGADTDAVANTNVIQGTMADWDFQDVAVYIGPKHNQVWKPVITAVHGSCCAGGMYFVNESDIVIASDDATFFDSHVSYGACSVFEAIGMRTFIPAREALRWMLLDLEERMSAQRALQVGLISEVVARETLFQHAHDLAAIIAAKPTTGVQGSVKAFWDALWPQFTDIDRWGMRYTYEASLHTPTWTQFKRPQWKLR